MGITGTGSRLVFVSQQFIGAKDIRIGSLNFHISLEMWFPDKNICLWKSFSLTTALHGNATLEFNRKQPGSQERYSSTVTIYACKIDLILKSLDPSFDFWHQSVLLICLTCFPNSPPPAAGCPAPRNCPLQQSTALDWSWKPRSEISNAQQDRVFSSCFSVTSYFYLPLDSVTEHWHFFNINQNGSNWFPDVLEPTQTIH